MAKAYWVATYRSISNPDALAAYAKLAGPAIAAAGGRFLARGMPAQVYEAGLQQRTVLIEFDSVEAARAAHDKPGLSRSAGRARWGSRSGYSHRRRVVGARRVWRSFVAAALDII
jgi:uncharacterized protein (DUF1330 family)